MSTKVTYNLKDDNQEIQKQLGCMNGIFQLFDRRYLLGQRRHGHNHKKLLQGESDNGKNEFDKATEKPKEKTPSKVVKEKHRVSVESSRNSVSSSCSSLDCSKRVQTEVSSFCPSIISEPSSPTLHKKQADLSVESADIRDVVKDSMTRKPRVVSVKPVAKDERKGPVMTHVDSPRPLQPAKPVSVSYERKDQNLAKLREISRGVKDVRKEASRFSYDGRESSYKLKSVSNVKEIPRLSLDSKQSSMRNRANVVDETHEPGSNKRPSSSVVARLMGLEVVNDSVNGGESLKIKPCVDDESVSRVLKKDEESKRNNVKELGSPRRGIGNGITRIPLEPAPWKQEVQKQPGKNKKALEKSDNGCHSVYGQIEKRLTEVEFKTSGKDLRALKQILEAIQRTKMKLEKTEQNQKLVQPISPTAAMKPVKLTSDSMAIEKPQKVKKVNHATGRRCATDRTKKSSSPENLTGQNYRNSRNPGTVSPRLQRSKNGVDKQSIHVLRKQSNSRNSKINSINQSPRSLSQHGDTVSFPSESDVSVASQNDPEVTSTDWSRENKSKFAERLIEYKPTAELAMLTIEQPSPVSVLDAFYSEDLPSPIQKKSNAFKDDDDIRFNEPEWNQVGIDNLVKSTELNQSSSEFNLMKIENIKHLVHQIELLNTTSDESTIDAREAINGDQKYINEILLASGILKNLGFTTIIHLHPTDSLINPELFNVLEKTQECNKGNRSSKPEKIRRKLIFDTVNHILVKKLARSASSGLCTSKRKGRILNEEKLLKELCSEIHNLENNTSDGLYDEVLNIVAEDVNEQSEDWADNCNEVPALILDMERLIFKDLISEIVNAEVAGLKDGPRRQLYLV